MPFQTVFYRTSLKKTPLICPFAELGGGYMYLHMMNSQILATNSFDYKPNLSNFVQSRSLAQSPTHNLI